MKKTRSRIWAGVLALMMMVTAFVPVQRVEAEDAVTAEPGASNITFDTARDIIFNSSIAEEMSRSDTKRYYKFSVREASELNLAFSFEYSSETNIDVYDKSKTSVFHTRCKDYSFSKNGIYLTGGDYYLGIETHSPYSMLVSANSLSESFTETQDSDNNSASKASKIALEKKYKGVLAQNDELDYYKFSIPARGKVTVNLTNSTDDYIKYSIYDSNLNGAYMNTLYKSYKVAQEVTLAGGTYYLVISQDSDGKGVGSYNFSLNYTLTIPDGPTIKSVKNNAKKKITVKWGSVSGADGYELQCSKDKKFKNGVKKKTLSSSKSSASYTGLTKKKTYYVRIRSYKKIDNSVKYSKWSTKKSVVIKK